MKTIDPRDAYVLVIEDNLQNVVLITRLLNHLGVRHYEWKASSIHIQEVIDQMPRLDLVLMDLHLPKEDGFTALAKLRSDPRFTQTRVVAITADGDPAMLQKAKSAGFNGFIGKPINVGKFPEQITHILQGHEIWDLGYN